MVFLAQNGYRTIAHDRRGHGRSSQPSGGNDMDTYADDLAALFEELDLRDAVMVGHSTGGGEVTRYIGRHGTSRVAKAVLVDAVPPLVLKTEANPEGTPIEALDDLRAAVAADPSQLCRDWASGPFFGANRPGANVSQGIQDAFWFQAMQAGRKNAYECIKAFSETDFTEDLKRFDVPTLIVHGDDDQIVPIGRLGVSVVEARRERDAKGLRGRAPRPAFHARGSSQRRPAGVHRGVRFVSPGGEASFGPLRLEEALWEGLVYCEEWKHRCRWQFQPFGKEEVMNIAIVGATGLVGSQLVSLAKSRGHEVIDLSRSPAPT